MCGRFVLAADPASLQKAFSLASPPDIQPRYNIAPTQTVPVITNEAPNALSMLRWGLIPSWSKDMSAASKMINARAETAAEKPAFRAAFRRRRCLIPATGFYEWQARENGRAPMFIYLKNTPVFAFAGLWEIWHSPQGDEMRTFTIITTEANSFMRTIHDRMPVILHPADYETWLDTSDVPVEVLCSLLRPFEAAEMHAYEVSKMVNRPTVDIPELIAPVA
jgi:putative SOS response-associated peptidase YedK